MTDDMTAGYLAQHAKAAAPGSIRVGRTIVTHVAEFEHDESTGLWTPARKEQP